MSVEVVHESFERGSHPWKRLMCLVCRQNGHEWFLSAVAPDWKITLRNRTSGLGATKIYCLPEAISCAPDFSFTRGLDCMPEECPPVIIPMATRCDLSHAAVATVCRLMRDGATLAIDPSPGSLCTAPLGLSFVHLIARRDDAIFFRVTIGTTVYKNGECVLRGPFP